MITRSEIIQRIIGTYIEDDTAPKPPLFEWIQAECRNGCFKQALESCLKNQPEPLRIDLTLVEKIENEKITVRIPARLLDHENTSTFCTEVMFEINPITLSINRI